MTKRSPFAVFFLPAITFGIYAIIWWVKTKDEMNAKGDQIPTAWLLIIPIANHYWLWKYCEGVGKVTNNALGAGPAFALVFFLGSIGMAIIQNAFNKL